MFLNSYSCDRCWHKWAAVGGDQPAGCPECGVVCWPADSYDISSDINCRIVIHMRGGHVENVECPAGIDVQIITHPLHELV